MDSAILLLTETLFDLLRKLHATTRSKLIQWMPSRGVDFYGMPLIYMCACNTFSFGETKWRRRDVARLVVCGICNSLWL